MKFIEKMSTAINDNDLESFKKIIDSLPTIEEMDDEEQLTPLGAIGYDFVNNSDKLEFGRYLLAKGAKVDVEYHGFTPLSYAAHQGLIDWVNVLIGHGADVNYVPDRDWPPILKAIQSDQVDVLRIFLNNPGINLADAKTHMFGMTFSQFAKKKAAKKCLELIKEMKLK